MRWKSSGLWCTVGLVVVALAVPVRAQPIHDLAEHLVGLSEPVETSAGKAPTLTLRSASLEAPLRGVVLRGYAPDTTAKGWIRFEEAGTWRQWKPLYIVYSVTDGSFLAGYRDDDVRTPTRFEIKFSPASAREFRVFEAGTFTDTEAAEPGPLPAPGASGHLRGPNHHITPPRLIRRGAWMAQPFRGEPISLARPDYRYATLHHAAGFGATTYREGLEQVRRIQEFHQEVRGWSDIGYHFIFDQSGRLYQGRPFQRRGESLDDAPALVQGAHVGGYNTGNIGISLLGCYHPSEGAYCDDELQPAVFDSVATLFAFVAEGYDVSPGSVYGHRDFSVTACPGDNIYTLMGDLKARVRDLLLTGNQPVGRAIIAATSDEAGVVQLNWSFLEDGGIVAFRIERAHGDEAEVVYEGSAAAAAEFVDRDVEATGEVVYRLYARDQYGREQLLAVSEVQIPAPEEYVLAPAFPNPARGQATIRYFLRQEGLVSLRIFDAAGREVAVLAGAYQEGGRWYRRRFEVGGLASGTYFCRLVVEGFSGRSFIASRALVVVP